MPIDVVQPCFVLMKYNPGYHTTGLPYACQEHGCMKHFSPHVLPVENIHMETFIAWKVELFPSIPL